MKRLVFISNMASPYQIKFCYALNNHFNTEFWFHVYLEKNRPDWWKIPLGKKCKILKKVFLKKQRKYLSFELIAKLRQFNPEIILLGGFSHLSNYLAYIWGKKRGKKVVIFRESYRKKNKSGIVELVKKNCFTRIIRFLYRNIDGVIASNEEAYKQLMEEFEFKKVFLGHYAADIDMQLKHNLRCEKRQYTILFANRLISNYEPLLAIDIVGEISQCYKIKMLMNPEGVLIEDCKSKINNKGLNHIINFVSEPSNWDELHLVYKNSDILLLPATFSNGNLTIYDAMASGCGIVISNNILGISNSLIVDNENGFICFTKEDYIKAIIKYIENPELFISHGLVNRNKIMKYSATNTAELFSNILNNI